MLRFDEKISFTEDEIVSFTSFETILKDLDVIKILITRKDDPNIGSIYYTCNDMIYKLNDAGELIYRGQANKQMPVANTSKHPAAVIVYKYIIKEIDNDIYDVAFMDTSNTCIKSYIMKECGLLGGDENEKIN